MQEDSTWSSRDVFIRRHGLSNVAVWDEVHRQMDEDTVEPENYWGHFEMDDGA
jgi:hypothetical protein